MSICTEFIDCTGIIGILIGQATEVTTGSLFITFLIIMMAIMSVAFMFRIPLEYTSLLILPLILGYAAYYTGWVAALAAILIYLAILITKNFILVK